MTAYTESFPTLRELTKFINKMHLNKNDVFPPIEKNGQWFLVYFIKE